MDVCVGDGQRHTLTLLSYTYNDEVTSLAAFCNQRRFNLQEEYLLGELLFSDNLVHIGCFFYLRYYKIGAKVMKILSNK